MKRNPYLTAAAERFLRCIRDGVDNYAVQDGLEVWVDSSRFSPKTVNYCLHYCLISESRYASAGMHIYEINEDGRCVLNSHEYIPEIVRVLREKP